MQLDIKTLIVMNCVTVAVGAAAMAVIWRETRRRFPGASLWLGSMALHLAALVLILCRGALPVFFTVLVSNVLLIAGAVMLLKGLERFAGGPGFGLFDFAPVAAQFLLTGYFLYVQPSMTLREISISCLIVVLYLRGCWLLFHVFEAPMRRMMRIPGFVLGGYVLASVVRIVMLAASPLGTADFFKSGAADALAVAAYTVLAVCLTIGLILMVNRRLLAEVTAQEEKFAKAFQQSPQALFLSTLSDGRIFEVNAGFADVTGHRPEEAVGKTAAELGLWEDEAEGAAVAAELAEGRSVRGREAHIRSRSGGRIVGLFAADALEIGGERCLLASVSDVTELWEMRERLRIMATHDALTGLPNRSLFYDRFETALANAERTGKKLAVLSLDLDRFKWINDTFGHPAGDKVLVEAAERLRGVVRKVDAVARFGGDEFALLLWEVSGRQDALTVARKILEAFRRPFLVAGRPVELTASLGAALHPEDGRDLETLIKRSDERLYRVKARGRDGCLADDADEEPPSPGRLSRS